ncbi:serine/threonine-protein kinase [Kribbella albertanoniae]|uniref:non-specific serine/threonine protein kinase n=1 Tax=Kribbella albertanoniae TaxID=1266829 RepID=A0A4R4Q5E7_9ACTN|nr:serine/threonine-protein kinase [Kribbella albertanoniae]TDC30391.1 serine/threonine protein kinase [Kribbella albertanoniae]
MNGEVLAGRYRLLTLLGRGGAGEVWQAEDVVLDRQVAVKLLRSLDGDPMDAVARFQAEAQAAARLMHPNVVATYDVGAADDRVFLVMELVSGPDLAQLMRTAGLPSAKLVADIAVQGARALDAAHAAGIVHRDVKPGNLLLAPDGTLKMTDFGIAKRAGGETTALGVLLGTASYVSPEQVTGGAATSASDWYSLGCVLYELLAGTPPFTGATVETVMRQHLESQPAPIIRNDVTPALAALVMQLLAKNPADRPASATEVTAILSSTAHDNTQAIALPPISNATQVLHLPPREEEPAELDRPRRSLPFAKVLVAAAVVLAAVVGVTLLKEGVKGDPSAQAGGTPSAPAAKVTASTKPKPTATPTPTPKPSKTPSKTLTKKPTKKPDQYPHVVAQLRQLADKVRASGQNQQQWPGQTQPKSKAPGLAARDLDQAAEQLSRGEVDAARDNYEDAKKRLVEAQREHRWQPTAEIYIGFAQLDRSMPQGDSGDGDGDGDE